MSELPRINGSQKKGGVLCRGYFVRWGDGTYEPVLTPPGYDWKGEIYAMGAKGQDNLQANGERPEKEADVPKSGSG